MNLKLIEKNLCNQFKKNFFKSIRKQLDAYSYETNSFIFDDNYLQDTLYQQIWRLIGGQLKNNIAN